MLIADIIEISGRHFLFSLSIFLRECINCLQLFNMKSKYNWLSLLPGSLGLKFSFHFVALDFRQGVVTECLHLRYSNIFLQQEKFEIISVISCNTRSNIWYVHYAESIYQHDLISLFFVILHSPFLLIFFY